MTYEEATRALARMSLAPVRPAAFRQPKPAVEKQLRAFDNCTRTRRGRWSCRAVR